MTKSTLNSALVAAFLAAGFAVSFGQNPSPLLVLPEDKLIAVLKSDASQKEKADACRQLAVIGTRNAVPALAALLGDEKLAHMARYGLEPIPDSSVDTALREALGKLKGRPLVGVIGSLGVRRDAAAVEGLVKCLADPDNEVAQAAARSLGNIGTQAAVRGLEDALGKAPAANQPALSEGLLRCLEALVAKGQANEAREIADRLRGFPSAPAYVRTTALRLAVQLRQQEGLPLLREALRGEDLAQMMAVIGLVQDNPAREVTGVLTNALPQLSADRQILVVQVLAKRRDVTALPALIQHARAGAKPVRLAAIRALTEMGEASALPVLQELMKDPDREVAQAALESLGAFPGTEPDAVALAMLSGKEGKERIAAIELASRRRMVNSIPQLLKVAGDTDPQVRSVAVRKIGELGSLGVLPSLFDFLSKAKESSDLDAAEQAIGAICVRADKPEACVEPVVAQLASAQPGPKGVLLRVLSAVGGAGALKAVRVAVGDANAEVRAAAIRALGDWKTAEAAPDLLALARNAGNPGDKTLCLRAYLGLAANTDLPADQRLSMCRQSGPLVERPEEKKLLLGALGGINSTDSLALITPYLEDAAIKNEAATAALGIAERLMRGQEAAKHAAKVVESLEKIAQAGVSQELTTRAKNMQTRARERTGGTR